jgi:hypothetical protein
MTTGTLPNAAKHIAGLGSMREPLRHSGRELCAKIDEVNFVAERASPESITRVFAFSDHTSAQGLWIPGPR